MVEDTCGSEEGMEYVQPWGGEAKSGGGHATPSSSWEVPGLPSHQGLESPDGSEPIYLDTLL